MMVSRYSGDAVSMSCTVVCHEIELHFTDAAEAVVNSNASPVSVRRAVHLVCRQLPDVSSRRAQTKSWSKKHKSSAAKLE